MPANSKPPQTSPTPAASRQNGAARDDRSEETGPTSTATSDAADTSTSTAPPEQQTRVAPAAPATTTSTTPRPAKKVWRCAPGSLALGLAFMLITGLGIPAAAVYSLYAGITGFGDQQVLVLSIIGGLAVLALFFGWRLILHPRIKYRDDMVRVINPFRTHRLHLDDITVFRPGPDGLVVGTRETEVEAWAVQKSGRAIANRRRTRADQVADQLWAIWEDYHQPEYDSDGTVRIRWAHPGEEDLLTELERSASVARLGHIFPADKFPYPTEEIRRRWQDALADRVKLIMIAEVDGEPAGYACFGDRTIFHLGVAAEHQRRGVGTALLDAAEEELFADASTPDIVLWVLEENDVARTFYRENGWSDADHQTRTAEFPPHPVEVMMVRRNPHLARRGR